VPEVGAWRTGDSHVEIGAQASALVKNQLLRVRLRRARSGSPSLPVLSHTCRKGAAGVRGRRCSTMAGFLQLPVKCKNAPGANPSRSEPPIPKRYWMFLSGCFSTRCHSAAASAAIASIAGNCRMELSQANLPL